MWTAWKPKLPQYGAQDNRLLSPEGKPLSQSIQSVSVNLDHRSYDIDIGTGIIADSGQRITDRCSMSHAVIITDENVQPTYAQQVGESLAEREVDVDLLTVAAGEPSKSVRTADALWDALLEAQTDRQTTVIAVGGGVIGDLAGFVAATFARGLDFVQVPTTLLAQVDSSVGGKVGINLAHAKNMVGAFWQPQYVLIDSAVLKTLPDREYRAGLAEVVKYGVILDAEFFAFLERHVEAINQRQDDVLREIVARCCRLKADIVEVDEREESGRRAVLNYGHTFAHALEATTGYDQLLHGEAVAMGMLCASRLAQSLALIGDDLTKRQHELLTALELPVSMPQVDVEELLVAMQHDKKTARGQLRFVLPTCLGHVELVQDVDPNLVRKAFFDP